MFVRADDRNPKRFRILNLGFVRNLVLGAWDLRRGFTLLETVVALSVIIGAVIGPVTLVTRGLVGGSFSKNKIVALNLSQEGVELARLIRDSNILCDQLNGGSDYDWKKHPVRGNLSDAYALDVENKATIRCGATNLGVPNPIGVDPDDDCTQSAATRLYRDSNGLYSHTVNTPTPFSRCVKICAPASDQPCSNDDRDPEVGAGEQMVVISTVTWKEKGADRKVELKERLYHWK